MKKYILPFLITTLFIAYSPNIDAKNFNGQLCPVFQQLTQNLRTGGYNGRYNSYTRGTVRQAHILQAHLNRLGFASGKVDGMLGPISDAAIKRMQRFLNVAPDGFVGPLTRAVLNNSCGKSNKELNGKIKNPVCVYNHAYQENYKNDSLSGILKNAENCYVLIDPLEGNASQYISQIKAKNNQIGCYMSAGTGEDWRDDFNELKPYLTKQAWGEWDGEYFVSQVNSQLKIIMKNRIKKFSNFGCDWVEFDNMDWAGDDDYRDEYDLEVTQKQSKNYITDLCTYTKSLGMKCMAKSITYNDSIFDGVTYESYTDEKDWWDKNELKTVLNDGKLGLIIHYDEKKCDTAHNDYKDIYGEKLSFICEDKNLKQYKHYNK